MTGTFDVRAVATGIVSYSERTAHTFPRNIEFAAMALPLHVEQIADLSPAKVDAWLRRILAWPISNLSDDRQLRGCLVAHRGHGIIFLEASETTAERRFTLSHELAHFIGHYLAARELAVARLGPSIIDVLDGERAPTPSERLSGVLVRCPLGVYRDVLNRDGPETLTAATERIEMEADAAAFLALAPPVDVAARCEAAGRKFDGDGILETLQTDFGLACSDAVNHLSVVLESIRRKPPTLVESLKAAARESGKAPGRSI